MEFPKLDVSGSIPVSCTFISWPTRDNEDHEEGPLDARGRSRFAISRLNAITDRFAKWARVWMIDLCLIHVKITGVTILCLTLPSVASGQTVASPSISVAFPTAPIKLDGLLDEPAWLEATTIAELVQQSPRPGALTPYRTQVRVIIQDNRLYFGFECTDPEPGSIAVHTMRRDGPMDGDDTVSIVLDTSGDKRTGYFFRVMDSAAQRVAAGAGRGGRASQVPSPFAMPHQTALHGAAASGFTAFVKFLAENGADLQAKDADGRTPLDLARGVGRAGIRGPAPEPFPETVALLESLMAAKGIPVSSPK